MKKTGLHKRIKSKKGFSIAEMLIAVLIVLMVSSLIAVGIPVASRAYRKVVDASNAELLLSTTVTKLRTELTMADVTSYDASSITFTDSEDHRSYTISSGTADGLTITDNSIPSPSAKTLVSEKASPDGLYTNFDGVSITQNGDISYLTITNLSVKRESDDHSMTSIPEFCIKLIADK